jgi:hypothetical protein
MILKNDIVDRLKNNKKKKTTCKYFYKLYLVNIKESPKHLLMETKIFYSRCIPKTDGINSFVSVQKVHSSVSFKPHLKRKSLWQLFYGKV